MTNLTEIRIVANDFNLDNTLNENLALKKSNRKLRNTLVIVLVTFLGILIAYNVSKSLEEDSKQRL